MPDFAGAALTWFGFLAWAGFVPALLTAVFGRFTPEEALDELFEGGLTRAAGPAVDFFWDLGATASACCRAQRARCAAAILAFPSGLIVGRLGTLNSLGSKLVALFLDPFGRPRRRAVPGVRRSETTAAVSSPPSKLRTCVRREISSSMAERISAVFISAQNTTLRRRAG